MSCRLAAFSVAPLSLLVNRAMTDTIGRAFRERQNAWWLVAQFG